MSIVDCADRRPGPNPPASLDDRGYIMVVLLISMAVTSIWMSAMLPTWRQQVVREKEAELIFRGEQYARAIYLYRQENGQASPPDIDTLVEQRYLRKRYLDPITGEDFLPISAQTVPGADAPQVGEAGPGGAGRAGGAGRGGGPGGASGFGAPVQGGITGVRSTSNDASLVVYQGQQTYSQFPFDWNFEAQRAGTAVPGAAGQPGDDGGPGSGGRGLNPDGGRGRGLGIPEAGGTGRAGGPTLGGRRGGAPAGPGRGGP